MHELGCLLLFLVLTIASCKADAPDYIAAVASQLVLRGKVFQTPGEHTLVNTYNSCCPFVGLGRRSKSPTGLRSASGQDRKV